MPDVQNTILNYGVRPVLVGAEWYFKPADDFKFVTRSINQRHFTIIFGIALKHPVGINYGTAAQILVLNQHFAGIPVEYLPIGF